MCSKDGDVIDTRAGSGFDVDGCVKAWNAVKPNHTLLPAKEFIEAALAITAIFDTMSGMKMVKDDIVGNAAKIKKNMTGAKHETLQGMVEKELEAAGGDVKTATKEGSTALALLWLKRALMLIEGMLRTLLNTESMPLSACVQVGYDLGLKMHHNFVMKGTFAVAVKAAPDRTKFMAQLAIGSTPEAVMAGLAKVNAKLTITVGSIDTFLKDKKIEV